MEFVSLHMDPPNEGVGSAARSIQADELDRLMLRFWAHSMMHGPAGPENTSGGLTSAATAWSRERPTDWSDTDISEITCKNITSIKNAPAVYIRSRCMMGVRSSYSWRLESGVNGCVWSIFLLHDTKNFPNDLVCEEQNAAELFNMYEYVKNWCSEMNSQHSPLWCRTSLQDLCELLNNKIC